MKSGILVFFMIIAFGLFIYQSKAVKRRLENNTKKVEQTTGKTLPNKESKKPVAVIAQTPKTVTQNLKSKYTKLESSLIPWYESNPEHIHHLICNPYLAGLFEKRTPWYGFYGAKYDMLEIYVHFAELDTLSNKINIVGLTRLRNTICEMKGYFSLEKAGLNKQSPGNKDLNTRYGVMGNVHLEEFSKGKKLGTFEGHWTADISEIDNKQKQLEFSGNALLVLGKWQSSVTPTVKDFCVSGDIFSVGDSIFKVFTYGERDVTLNEPFASNGWKNYYNQDEWWASYFAQ